MEEIAMGGTSMVNTTAMDVMTNTTVMDAMTNTTVMDAVTNMTVMDAMTNMTVIVGAEATITGTVWRARFKECLVAPFENTTRGCLKLEDVQHS